MKSGFFKDFGIPVADCEVEVGMHPQFRFPLVYFRSQGNPLVGLDLTGASQLRQMLTHAGEIENAREIDRHIKTCQQFG